MGLLRKQFHKKLSDESKRCVNTSQSRTVFLQRHSEHFHTSAYYYQVRFRVLSPARRNVRSNKRHAVSDGTRHGTRASHAPAPPVLQRTTWPIHRRLWAADRTRYASNHRLPPADNCNCAVNQLLMHCIVQNYSPSLINLLARCMLAISV